MHAYAVESNERTKIPFFIAAISIGMVSLIRSILGQYGVDFSFSAYVPSSFAIYGILYTLFDRFVWRIDYFIKFGFLASPNLNGRWQGELRSSRHDFKVSIPITIIIHQTWTKISINLETEKTESESLMASFRIKNPSLIRLSWEYASKSKPQYFREGYVHSGITRLKIKLDDGMIQKRLEGDYYTDQGRDSYGEIILNRTTN